MSSFEEELHQAVQAREAAAVSAQAIGERVRRQNAAARVEAVGRLNRLGGYTCNFLTKRGVPPVEVAAGVQTKFRGPRLVTLCSGWWLHPTFLTTDGHLVHVTNGKSRFGDELERKIKPGQYYRGRFEDTAAAVVPYDRGVAWATFADLRRLSAWSSVAEFNTFYYGDLYQPLVEFPMIYDALLIPGSGDELHLATFVEDDRKYLVTALHYELRTSALKLVDSRR